MAAFRAVENGRYLVRAANTGITAVVDPRGRVQEPTALFDRTVLVRDVPFVAETTLLRPPRRRLRMGLLRDCRSPSLAATFRRRAVLPDRTLGRYRV